MTYGSKIHPIAAVEIEVSPWSYEEETKKGMTSNFFWLICVDYRCYSHRNGKGSQCLSGRLFVSLRCERCMTTVANQNQSQTIRPGHIHWSH